MTISKCQELLACYKRTGIIDFPVGMNDHEFEMLASVFDENLTGWELIKYEQSKRLIESCLKDCLADKTNQALIRLIAHCAVAHTKHYHFSELIYDGTEKTKELIRIYQEMYPVLIQMWQDAFKEIPYFAIKFAEFQFLYGPLEFRKNNFTNSQNKIE